MARLIDADALKEYIDMQKGRPFIGCTIGEALKMMTDEQPTIGERKRGKWIDITKHGGVFLWKCSECGELELNDTDYCPNCGAVMDGKVSND